MENELKLYYAVSSQDENVVIQLLDKGYDPNVITRFKYMIPLHKAVECRNVDITKHLLSNGADANVRDFLGLGVFHILSMFSSLPELKDILHNIEGTFIVCKYNYAPLEEDYEIKTLEIARMLFISKANMNMTSKLGSTPLHIASKYNNQTMVKFFLERGADINILDSNDNTPLIYAACSGNTTISKMLLDYGAKIESRNKEECSPLHYAVATNNDELTSLFLTRGADTNVVDKYNRSVLHKAIGNKNITSVKLLLNHGINCNLRDNHGYTALHYAITLQNREITDMLLASGADPNIMNNEKHTPLYHALLYRYSANVESLILYGADINIVDDTGKTPLSNTCLDIIDNKNVEVIISHFTILEYLMPDNIKNQIGYKINAELINNSKRYSTVKQKCVDEINLLKTIKFHSGYSAEIFLNKNKSNIFHKFIKYPNIINIIESRFLIYSSIIKKSIDIGNYRRKLLDNAVDTISEIRLLNILPIDIKYIILEMLNNKDLITLNNNT
ncbi:ankyrin repeat family protein [Flamingopox virus FGPVKD09]|uniref:Ankyrin repeat family protein n=1 Tax=Flamingopox virus FGPVKD09 TaxID=2059380 RepID=A0A2H4X2Q4_9POXV|nr:ankyrin repeat family protein [Flamingopox virus FGPVKD09]AUD40338.1 ankyrin repeat family protein [Flamingopox virus FGPVKD09]